MAEFVPPDFAVPLRLETTDFVLEPLGPQHNDEDYAAWTSSLEHIRLTPGFPWGTATERASRTPCSIRATAT